MRVPAPRHATLSELRFCVCVFPDVINYDAKVEESDVTNVRWLSEEDVYSFFDETVVSLQQALEQTYVLVLSSHIFSIASERSERTLPSFCHVLWRGCSGDGAMVARTTCSFRVASSSSLLCHLCFFFWQGRLVHMPMNTASRGLFSPFFLRSNVCVFTKSSLCARRSWIENSFAL